MKVIGALYAEKPGREVSAAIGGSFQRDRVVLFQRWIIHSKSEKNLAESTFQPEKIGGKSVYIAIRHLSDECEKKT